MARYRPDYTLKVAREVIDELKVVGNATTKSDKDTLLKYYINHQQSVIDKQREEITKYRNFFELLKGFIPSSGKLMR